MINAILSLVLRTLLMYIIAFAVMRIMGKREIGELSTFDLVISVMIAEIAVFVIEDLERPLYEGLIPLCILLLIQIGMALIALHSRRIRLLSDGKPSMIIHKGKIDRKEMKRQRYNLDDLLTQLRLNNIQNIADVEFAVLETTGQLSVIKKSDNSDTSSDGGGSGTSSNDKRGNSSNNSNSSNSGGSNSSNNSNTSQLPSSKSANMSSDIRYAEIPLSLIMDGKLQQSNLKKIGKTTGWLKKQIQSKGAKEFKDVFYCSLDHEGNLYVSLKNE